MYIIPVAIMMRNKPDFKRIKTTLILTSALFSIMHLVNGYNSGTAFLQLIFTFIMDLFWGAIYLRTGSILITIIFHLIYDVLVETLVLPNPIQVSYLIVLFLVQSLPIVLTYVIIRKSKIEEIKDTWANVWSE